MAAFRDYRPVIQAGAQRSGRRAGWEADTARVRQVFGWIVSGSWSRPEIHLLRRAARSALL
ncbi:MAG TPA: hypothetical protein VKV80_03885 [Streptosporangiaceae bacterium]|nr:hypothetical protein [Streptosporangiaceae bacterium]